MVAEPVRGPCSDTHVLRALHRVSSPTRLTIQSGAPVNMLLSLTKTARRMANPVSVLEDHQMGRIGLRPIAVPSGRAGRSETLPIHVCLGNHRPYSLHRV